MKNLNKLLFFCVAVLVILLASCSKNNEDDIKELLTEKTKMSSKSKSFSMIESKYVYQCPRCGFIYDKKYNGYCSCQIYLCTSDAPFVDYTCRNPDCKKSHDLSFVGQCECGEYLLGGFRTRKLCRECGNEHYCLCCGGCNSNPCVCCRTCKEPLCICDKECLVCGNYYCNGVHNDDGGGSGNEGNQEEEMSPPITDPMTNVTIALKLTGVVPLTYKLETFISSDSANLERWGVLGIAYYVRYGYPYNNPNQWELIVEQAMPGTDNRYNYIYTFVNPRHGVYNIKAVIHFKYAPPFESETRGVQF